MNEPLGLGLVGAGWFGAFCLKAYQELSEVKVVAVADVDFERARAAAPQNARLYADFESLLADESVQIVAINTPPYLHGSMVRQAAESGKHVFVEKPLATTLSEAQAAVRAVQVPGVQFSIDYVLRRHPLHKLAGQVLRTGSLGDFQHWSLENFASDDPLGPEHWFWDAQRSGGIHDEHGVHFFDLCNQLAGGAPDRVSGCRQRRADGRLDRASATVQYGQRVLATFYHSFNQIGRFERTTIRLNCARGHLLIEGWIPTDLRLEGLVDEDGLEALRSLLGERLQILESFQGPEGSFRHGGITERIAARVVAHIHVPDRWGEYRRAVQAGMRDLVAAIQTGRQPEIGIQDALLSLAVALAASGEDNCGRPLPVVDF